MTKDLYNTIINYTITPYNFIQGDGIWFIGILDEELSDAQYCSLWQKMRIQHCAHGQIMSSDG